MLKKGHVYKAIYNQKIGNHITRNYILFSPNDDISSVLIRNSKYYANINVIFSINMGGIFRLFSYIGFNKLLRIERANTKEDIMEIETYLTKNNIQYDKKLNKIYGFREA
jgi:hypothetical protein